MRLLHSQLAYQNLELLVHRLLKLQYGAQFTSKMEGMLNDVRCEKLRQNDLRESSQKENQNYKSDSCGIEFSVQVLTTGFWPRTQDVQLVLPTSMTNCVNNFAEYYQSFTKALGMHRKVSITNALGRCVVEMNINNKTYKLSVTTLQAVVLNLFNPNENGSVPTYTTKEVMRLLQLNKKYAKRVLHSLSCSKYSVLENLDGRQILMGDRFTSSSTFSHSKKKLILPMQKSYLTKIFHERVPERVPERVVAIEAAIVRMMKLRRQMTHHELVDNVITELINILPTSGIHINVKTVKRCIERVMDREYIERDEHQSDLIRYLP